MKKINSTVAVLLVAFSLLVMVTPASATDATDKDKKYHCDVIALEEGGVYEELVVYCSGQDPIEDNTGTVCVFVTPLEMRGVCIHMHTFDGDIWYCFAGNEDNIVQVYDCQTVSSHVGWIVDIVKGLPIPIITCLPPEGICIGEDPQASTSSTSSTGSTPPEGDHVTCQKIEINYIVSRGPYYVCTVSVSDQHYEGSSGNCVSVHISPYGGDGVCVFLYPHQAEEDVCVGKYAYWSADASWNEREVYCYS